MCGCWSWAVSRISRRNRSAPEGSDEVGTEHLDRDRAVVLEVAGQVDRGHAAAPELALEQVAIAESVSQCRGRHVGHGQALSRGMLRICLRSRKVASIGTDSAAEYDNGHPVGRPQRHRPIPDVMLMSAAIRGRGRAR